MTSTSAPASLVTPDLCAEREGARPARAPISELRAEREGARPERTPRATCAQRSGEGARQVPAPRLLTSGPDLTSAQKGRARGQRELLGASCAQRSGEGARPARAPRLLISAPKLLVAEGAKPAQALLAVTCAQRWAGRPARTVMPRVRALAEGSGESDRTAQAAPDEQKRSDGAGRSRR